MGQNQYSNMDESLMKVISYEIQKKWGDDFIRMSTSAKRQLVAILIAILYWTKPIFKLGQKFDESNPQMKF